MSTSVVQFNPNQVPAFAKNRKGNSSLLNALAGSGGSAGFKNRISIKGGVFRLVSGGKEIASIEERYLDVVMVNAAKDISRTFYAEKFDEENVAGPVCWSSDGTTPDADSKQRQSNACANCEKNAKGSGDNDSRACRFQQRVAVVLANDLEGNVLQLTVPGKSLFGKEDNGNHPMQSYARWLKAQNVEPDTIITRVKFDTKESHPKLFFKAMRYLNDDEFAIVEDKAATEDAKQAVLLNPAQVDGVAPKPKFEDDEFAKPPKPKAKAAPKVEPEEEDEPPAPAAKRGRAKKTEAAPADTDEAEPTVRKAPEAPTIPARPPLADTIASWDTDD